MLRILTSLLVILLMNGPTWALEKQSSTLNIQEDPQLQMDDKPLPLFNKVEVGGEQLAASPSPSDSHSATAAPKEAQAVQKEPTDPAKQPQVNQKNNEAEKLKPVQPEAKPVGSESKPAGSKPIGPKPEQAATLDLPKAAKPDTQQAGLETKNNTQDNVGANETKPDLQVLDFVLTNQVVNREPQEMLESFAVGAKRAAAFARLKAETNTAVTFVWYRNGKEYTRYETPVHSGKQWRTFSSVTLCAGNWKVQLLGENKEVLAEKTFAVQ